MKQLGLLILYTPLILSALDLSKNDNGFYPDAPWEGHEKWTAQQHFDASQAPLDTQSQNETVVPVHVITYHYHRAVNQGSLEAVDALVTRKCRNNEQLKSLLSPTDLAPLHTGRNNGYAWSPETLYVLACVILTDPKKRDAANIDKAAHYVKISAESGHNLSNAQFLAWHLDGLKILTLPDRDKKTYWNTFMACGKEPDMRVKEILALDLKETMEKK